MNPGRRQATAQTLRLLLPKALRGRAWWVAEVGPGVLRLVDNPAGIVHAPVLRLTPDLRGRLAVPHAVRHAAGWSGEHRLLVLSEGDGTRLTVTDRSHALNAVTTTAPSPREILHWQS